MKVVLILMLLCIPILLMSQMGEPLEYGITFSFANGQITASGGNNYYEFDVMAQKESASDPQSYLRDLWVAIEYDSLAFGTWVNDTGNLTVTQGTLIPVSDYGMTINDNFDNRFVISPYLDTSTAQTLPATATQVAHVKIKLFDASKYTGLSFYLDYMQGEQFVYNYWWYDPVFAGNTLNDPLIAAPAANAATAVCHNGFTARWSEVPGATSYRLDVLESNGTTYVTGYQNKQVALNLARVETVGIDTAYKYRVRAYNGASSLNSNLIDVSTTPTIIGTSANTSITGAAVTVDVPLVTSDPPFTDNDVTINPVNTSSYDYSLALSWHPDGFEGMPYARLVCTVNCSDNTALNGDYTINHAGMGFDPSAAKFKWGGIWRSLAFTSLNNTTSFTIADLAKGAKGQLIIAFDDGVGTLPVELSSFTVAINFQNNVNLQWVTQSETNLSGFRIYRGLDDAIENAELLNAFIEGTNTSQVQSYIFCDTEITAAGVYYYWLENLDLDGSNTLHGPVAVTVNTIQTEVPAIPLVTKLQSIFPNPFNPSTTISYSLAKAEEVSFAVYNFKGQLIRDLAAPAKTVGNHQLSWNGKDNDNRACSTGIYYIKMKAGKDTFIDKLTLMK